MDFGLWEMNHVGGIGQTRCSVGEGAMLLLDLPSCLPIMSSTLVLQIELSNITKQLRTELIFHILQTRKM